MVLPLQGENHTMNKTMAMLAAMFILASSALGSSIVIMEENDLFLHKDDNYTQGLELSIVDVVDNEYGDTQKEVWGWRSRMYTPEDISCPTNQPGDRPWAGVTTVYHEWTVKDGEDAVMNGWELGILGPESSAEWMQETIHGWTGSTTPMGWSNQVPNEISAQYYRTYYHSLAGLGEKGRWMADLESPYGFCGGTTFDYIFVGLSTRAGWNIPPLHYSGTIEPKAILPKPFAYLLADVSGKYVLHNATLGHSFFRSHDDDVWDRELIPTVGQVNYGVCVGYKNFAVTYMQEFRSDEFEGQPEPFKCGMLRLEFGVSF